MIVAAACTPQGSNAKVSYCLEGVTKLAQGEQRNKWQGPAAGGKDAVYAGCELEPTQWSATGAGSIGCGLSGFGGVPSFVFWPVLQFDLLASTTSAVRTRACLVLGLSFYPLEQAPNPVVYAMSKVRDSNERFNLNRGILNPKPGDKRAPLLPKNSSADWRL